VERATAALKPVDGKGKTVNGVSREDGTVRFTSCKPFDGVTRSQHKVCVSKFIYAEVSPGARKASRRAAAGGKANQQTNGDEPPNDAKTDPEEALDRAYAATLQSTGRQISMTMTKALLPEFYASPKATPFTCQVPPDEKEVVFALESQPPKKQR
jgi:hypothetical protein